MHWSCAYRLDKAEIGGYRSGDDLSEDSMNDVDRV